MRNQYLSDNYDETVVFEKLLKHLYVVFSTFCCQSMSSYHAILIKSIIPRTGLLTSLTKAGLSIVISKKTTPCSKRLQGVIIYIKIGNHL